MHRERDLELIEVIDKHLENFFDDDEIKVFHGLEENEEENHIDIYWIKPIPDIRNFSILLTCGISRYPMDIPPNYNTDKYIEVIMILQDNWNFDKYDSKPNSEIWPVKHMNSIAKIPHTQKTWLGYGHTISWKSDKNECFPGTNFNSTIIFPTIGFDKLFNEIKLNDKTIKFYTAFPIYPEELNHKNKFGAESLVEKFRKYSLKESFSLNRINVIEKTSGNNV